MTYDVLNRLVSTTKQISNSLVNNNAETGVINVSSLQYDALGQLKVKNLGNTRSGSYYTGSPLDIQTYDYNIRGWLLGVNRSFITTPQSSYDSEIFGEGFSSPPGYTAGNYFGFELAYDKNGVLGNYNPLYNGNISGMTWKSIHDEQVLKYDFTYDETNRLKTADFNQYTYGYFNKSAGVNYSVNNLNYDKNGNILSMNQMGLRSVSAYNSSLVDQLTYTYQSGSNKLAKVVDAAEANGNSLGDFQDGTNGGDDYSYDANGNLISDANKGISSIQYNYLNLPQTITMTGKGTISYTYDAGGNKLQKQVVDNTNSTTTTTQYLSGLIYQNDVLQSIPQEEGRIRVNSSNTGFVFDYFLKDHLGNIRMTITDDNNAASPVIDATSYYPFGLSMKVIGKEGTGGLQNKFKYNSGSELQNKEFNDGSGLEIYDTYYRNLDTQIGRWWQLDPKANEGLENVSPYNSMQNNPIQKNDPLGDFDNYTIKEDGTIDRKITNDNTDNFKYQSKNGKTTDLGTFAKNENGFVEVPKAGEDFKNYSKEEKSYVEGFTFAAVLGAAHEFKLETGLNIQINQLDNSEGGHSSHGGQGQFADIRYVNKNGNVDEGSVWTDNSNGKNNFDASNSQSLVDKFAKFGFKNSPGRASILTENAKGNGPALKGTNFPGHGKAPNSYHHRHHIHLQHNMNFLNNQLK